MSQPKSKEPASPQSSDEMIAKPAKTRFWLDKVDTSQSDLLLLACCFVQGLLDASAFNNWGTFVGMQTGNTIILALSTGDLPRGQPWAFGLTLISIVSFFVGCFTATRVFTMFLPTRRLTFSANFLVQCLLIVIAAALTTASVMVTESDEELEVLLKDPKIMIGIAPLSFQSGMTIATSRMIGYGNEIPVVVYTSTYAALAGDMKLFQLWPPSANKPRNRRIIAVLCVFAGAVISTWIEVRSIGMVAVLWMAAGVKLVLAAVVALLLPRKQEPPNDSIKA